MTHQKIARAAVTLGAIATLTLGFGGSNSVAQAAPEAHHRDHHVRFDFDGHRFRAPREFQRQYWGWRYHRFYPSLYVAYVTEPVTCAAYYFDEEDARWYCFTGD